VTLPTSSTPPPKPEIHVPEDASDRHPRRPPPRRGTTVTTLTNEDIVNGGADTFPDLCRPPRRRDTIGTVLTNVMILPARIPPSFTFLDILPIAPFVRSRARRGKQVQGRRAARVRARMLRTQGSHNIPLEISFYLSSFVSALQRRKSIDPPTLSEPFPFVSDFPFSQCLWHSVTAVLHNSVTQLVDALTGLERILTAPIPFSCVLNPRFMLTS
jgi:hypothetical protein